MTYGLQLFNNNGSLMFDSTYATGGVCLGFYNIPSGGTTLTFPDLPAGQGMALSKNGGFGLNYSFDNGLGYPRFTFPSSISGYSAVLFVA